MLPLPGLRSETKRRRKGGWLSRWGCLGWVLAWAWSCLHAASLPGLFGTGVDSTGNLLPDGAVDPHYELTVSSDANHPGPEAFTLESGWPVAPAGPWMAEGPASRWIAPSSGQLVGNPPGTYIFRTVFDLTGFNPLLVRIDGRWAAENQAVEIRLNGISLGRPGGNFESFVEFAITEGFTEGTNTLDFVVAKPAGLSASCGLRVEMSGTITDPTAPPFLKQPPAGGLWFTGDTLRLEVAAEGTGPLRYQWRRDSIPLPGRTESALILPQITLAEAGRYDVVVSNDGGSVTSPPAMITVLSRVPGGFSTGTDAHGSVLPTLAADPHYELVGSPAGSDPLTVIVPDLMVPPLASAGWVTNSETSKWIVPQSAAGFVPGGNYVFRTTFDLTGFDPFSALLTGRWACESGGADVRLNGVSLGLFPPGQPGAWTPILLTGGFRTGTNVLEFEVYYNATIPWGPGLRVDGLKLGATALAVPPALQASTDGAGITLAWPQSAKGFKLFTTAELNPVPVWTEVDVVPVPVGEFFTVSLPATSPSALYRLQGSGGQGSGGQNGEPPRPLEVQAEFTRPGSAIEPMTGARIDDGLASTKRTPLATWPKEDGPAFRTPAMPAGRLYSATLDTGTMLATDDVGDTITHIYRSTDRGRTWTTNSFGRVPSSINRIRRITQIQGPTKMLVVAFVFADSIPKMYVSSDDAVTWSAPAVFPTFASMTYRNCRVQETPGSTPAERKLLIAPYGIRASLSAPDAAATRVYRTRETLADLEAGATPTVEMIFKISLPDFYGAEPGLGVSPGIIDLQDLAEGGQSNKLLKAGAFAGRKYGGNSIVQIIAGTGAGQSRVIQTNDADTLTVTRDWTLPPDSSSAFRIAKLPVNGSGVHIHNILYVPELTDGTKDVLFLATGDGTTSGSILKLTGISSAPAGLDLTGEGFNFQMATVVATNRQPVDMAYRGGQLIAQGADSDSCYCVNDTAPYSVTTTVIDNTSTTRNEWNYPMDGGDLDNYSIVCSDSNTAGQYNAIMYGDFLTGDVAKIANAMEGVFRGSENGVSGLYSIGSSFVGRVYSKWGPHELVLPTVTYQPFVFLSEAQTNLNDNADFSQDVGGVPKGWTRTATDGTQVCEGAPSYGGGRHVRASRTGTGILAFERSFSPVAPGELWSYGAAVRNRSLRDAMTPVHITMYAGGTVQVSRPAPSNSMRTFNHWYWFTTVATGQVATTRCRILMTTGTGNRGDVEFACPTLVKGLYKPAPGSRERDVLRYSLTATNATAWRTKRLEFYVRPFVESILTRNRTEDIVSIQDVNGGRYLLSYTDDANGNQAFVVRTFDAQGAPLATAQLGMLRHTDLDLFRVRVSFQNGQLTTTFGYPGSDVLTATVAWPGFWTPQTIAYGENLWSPGYRWTGWYWHNGLTQW